MSNSGVVKIDITASSAGVVSELRKVTGQLDNLNKTSNRITGQLSAGWKTLAGTIGAISFAAIGREVIAVADQYTLLESRLKLVTTGAENLAFIQQSLYDISLRTHQAQSNTVELYTRLARSTKQLGTSQTELLTMTELINQALIVSGANSVEAGAALMQMGQGLGAGALRGQELNSVLEQTPRIAQAIAEGMGVAVGDLKKLGEEGKITSEVVVKALLSQKEAIQREYSQMTTTVSQAMTDLGTVVKNIIAEANSSSQATAGIVTEIQNLASTISANKEGILSLFTGIISLSREAVEILGNFGQSIQGLRAVASGELSFFEYATSNAEELKTALAGIVPGVKEVNDKLEELATKRKDVAESWAFTSESRIAKQDELAAIDREIAALEIKKNTLESSQQKYVDTWQVAANANEQITASTTTNVARQVEVVKKGEVEKIKAHEKRKVKQEELDLSYEAFLQRQTVLNADNYIDGWRGAFEGRLEVEKQANGESEEGARETTSVIIDQWSNAYASIQSTVADWIYDFNISMDSIVDIFKRALAEMLSALAMSGIKKAFSNLFDGNAATTFFGGLTGGISDALGLDNGGGGGGLISSLASSITTGKALATVKGWLGIGGTATSGASGVAAGAGAAGTSGYVAGTGAGVGGSAATTAAGGTAATSGGGVGFSAAGMGAIATYATVAAAVVMVAKGIIDKSSRPNAANEIDYAGVTPANLQSMNDQWVKLSNTVLASIPGFQQYESAIYSANNSLLVATGATGTIALKYDESAAAGNRWSAFLTAASGALMDATSKADSFRAGIEGSGAELGKTSSLAEASRSNLEGLNSILSDTATAVSTLSSASQDAASGILGAAGDMRSIMRSLQQTAVYPDGGGVSYHADGGIITGATRWGSHILGESGPEAILPLHNGRDTLAKLEDKIDRLSSRLDKMTINVFVGNKQLHSDIQVVADRLDADRVGGGRRYI
jgi:tape measure domain-containing protein